MSYVGIEISYLTLESGDTTRQFHFAQRLSDHNGILTGEDNGFLKWFDILPDDFLELQQIYVDVLEPWTKTEARMTLHF